MFVPSTYNNIIPLKMNGNNRPQYYALFNTLAGAIDVIDNGIAHELATLQSQSFSSSSLVVDGGTGIRNNVVPELSPIVMEYLDKRGYIFNSREEEQQRAQILYKEMLNFHRLSAQQPLVIIPTYNCNMMCSYCWQRIYKMDSPIMNKEVAIRIFDVLPSFLGEQDPERVDLIIFGGEPLQDIPYLGERVIQLLELGRKAGFSTKIISNGTNLGSQVPYLRGKVDVIQITIDGPAEVHRKRRPLPKGQDSFAQTVEGVTKAVNAGICVNIRVNVDESNLSSIPKLADFILEQGWLDNGLVRPHLAPVKNHKPGNGTNTESKLLVRIMDLVTNYEHMKIFDLTGFPGIKYMRGFKESGLFSLHRFFNCEAQINFFAFDLYGDVYACWDAAGLKHLAVGRILPEVEIYQEKLNKWRNRSSLCIDGCQSCPSSPHCGGGCQFLAMEHNGTFLSQNCDSMMEGYIQAILADSDWLIARAEQGDHAIGLVTTDGVLTEAHRIYGLLENSGNDASNVVNCG